MEPGVYEIKGKDIYAQVFDTETKPAEKQRPEVHEKYIDVQFLASGKEKLGVLHRIPEIMKWQNGTMNAI